MQYTKTGHCLLLASHMDFPHSVKVLYFLSKPLRLASDGVATYMILTGERNRLAFRLQSIASIDDGVHMLEKECISSSCYLCSQIKSVCW